MDIEPDISDEIDLAVDFYRDEMMPATKDLIDKLNSDLYCGPTYYNADGQCSCFDDGAVPFNFSAALKELREYTDSIEDLSLEVYFDEETEKSKYARVDGTARAIIQELLGKELASYLRR